MRWLGLGAAWSLPLLVGCGTTTSPPELPAPIVLRPDSGIATPVPDRHEAALAAYRAGLMPLNATGVAQFSELHPRLDGRGVVIGILDSGIDPTVSGLNSTTDGHRKILDLRDFSGEGRIGLGTANLRGDTVFYRGHWLLGASRIRGLSAQPPLAGLVIEPHFGNGAGADLDADGAADDTLLVAVARGTAAWFILADTDGNGSLGDESPVRDFAIGHESFGWSQPGGDGPHIGVAANLADSAGSPRLTLVFDADGHGTHVAGIAAGHDMFGIEGFDGVAPGAQLLGLKIADDADGGITTTGSLVEAVSWAIEWADERQLPLVLNLSFGVGNQGDGSPRIDVILDSILRAHPDVIMTVSAGNDGPGLNTIGFPATARTTLAVGATLPLVFAGRGPDDPIPDPVAHYSSRGGHTPGPDLVAPGTAWSVVPRFDAGHEEKSGTSMAAPHVAGLAARLVGQLAADERPVIGSLVRHALTATARPIPFANVLDQGAGVANIAAASAWLNANHNAPVLLVDRPRGGAVWLPGRALPERFSVHLVRMDSTAPLAVKLRTDAGWLTVVGDSVATVDADGLTINLKLHRRPDPEPIVRVAAVLVESAVDEGLGVLLRVPVTDRIPLTVGSEAGHILAMQAGQAGHLVFPSDSGRSIRVVVNTLSRDGLVLVAVDGPQGLPVSSHPRMTAGSEENRWAIAIDGRDVVSGWYSVTLVAPPVRGVAARVRVSESPVSLSARIVDGRPVIAAVNLLSRSVSIRLGAQILGLQHRFQVVGEQARPRRVPLVIPAAATSLEIDSWMDPDDWQQFTDIGVSLRDRHGRLLVAAPLTHAFGRLRFPLPEELQGDTVYVEVSPAAVTAEPATPWTLSMVARFLWPGPRLLGGTFTGPFRLEPGERRTRHFASLPDSLAARQDLVPIIRVIAEAGELVSWTSTFGLLPGRGGSR